ncbi:hypothetical protein M23134_04739 [Microscilla marina ATCC 23134]|uniref:Uncharacterized protein n=1 Tax=Microscilla marina ATCC 23134 TaxID=313606 RepID=A1ZRG1_MICM2|nr:hypothetical protein M23134_04739 [Microscilla marina ATCC 23134]
MLYITTQLWLHFLSCQKLTKYKVMTVLYIQKPNIPQVGYTKYYLNKAY